MMNKGGKMADKTIGIVNDGELTQEKALSSLQIAAQAATEELPKALAKCSSQSEIDKVQTDRDIVMLAYLNCLKKSLVNTGSMFEKIASDLAKENANVKQKAGKLKDVNDALALFTDLVRLAASLALAFA
jgi:hypothetical protein